MTTSRGGIPDEKAQAAFLSALNQAPSHIRGLYKQCCDYDQQLKKLHYLYLAVGSYVKAALDKEIKVALDKELDPIIKKFKSKEIDEKTKTREEKLVIDKFDNIKKENLQAFTRTIHYVDKEKNTKAFALVLLDLGFKQRFPSPHAIKNKIMFPPKRSFWQKIGLQQLIKKNQVEQTEQGLEDFLSHQIENYKVHISILKQWFTFNLATGPNAMLGQLLNYILKYPFDNDLTIQTWKKAMEQNSHKDAKPEAEPKKSVLLFLNQIPNFYSTKEADHVKFLNALKKTLASTNHCFNSEESELLTLKSLVDNHLKTQQVAEEKMRPAAPIITYAPEAGAAATSLIRHHVVRPAQKIQPAPADKNVTSPKNSGFTELKSLPANNHRELKNDAALPTRLSSERLRRHRRITSMSQYVIGKPLESALDSKLPQPQPTAAPAAVPKQRLSHKRASAILKVVKLEFNLSKSDLPKLDLSQNPRNDPATEIIFNRKGGGAGQAFQLFRKTRKSGDTSAMPGSTNIPEDPQSPKHDKSN